MTTIPAKTRAAVRERDQDTCVRCGWHVNVAGGGSIHHRKRRKDGGHGLANLIVLCGDGVRGCHGWVTTHPAEAREDGLIVPTWENPLEVPLMYRGHLCLLTDEGEVRRT